MGHSQRNLSQLTNRKICYIQKYGSMLEKSLQSKNSAKLEKFSRVRKMCKIKKLCHNFKNGSRRSLEKLTCKETLRKMLQKQKYGSQNNVTTKNGSLLAKWVKVGKMCHAEKNSSELEKCVKGRKMGDDWMQETTQRVIKLLGLLLPDLLVKKCSYQTSL